MEILQYPTNLGTASTHNPGGGGGERDRKRIHSYFQGNSLYLHFKKPMVNSKILVFILKEVNSLLDLTQDFIKY